MEIVSEVQRDRSARSTNSDVIVVEDRVDMQCVRHVHLMSNVPAPQMAPFDRNLGGEWAKEAGVWHYRAEYPYRGVLDFDCEGWKKFRRLVVWGLEGQNRGTEGADVAKVTVRGALHEAAREFERLFGGRAQFGFVRRLPKGAEHCMDVGDLMLLEADWMLERCVAVGGSGMGAEVVDAAEVQR